MKNVLTPSVQHYSLQKEITVTTDASEKAVNGFRLQKGQPVQVYPTQKQL